MKTKFTVKLLDALLKPKKGLIWICSLKKFTFFNGDEKVTKVVPLDLERERERERVRFKGIYATCNRASMPH